MRRVAIFVCIVMFLGFALMNAEAGSRDRGNRWEQKNYSGGGVVSKTRENQGNLADQIHALAKEGRYEEACQLAQVALARQEKRWGPESPEFAGALNRVANLNLLAHHWLKAIDLYQQALRIREKVLPPDDPGTAATLAGLASVLHGRGVL